jgi:hypothetical protein
MIEKEAIMIFEDVGADDQQSFGINQMNS